MDRQLAQQVTAFLESRGGRATFANIRHAVGMHVQKKDLNRTLYGLQKNGSVTKLADSPPTWGLSGGGRSSNAQVSHGARRNPMKGGRGGRPRPYNPPPPMPTPSSMAPQPQGNNTESAVLQTLSTQGTMTGLQLAKSLQFLSRKSVNPLLYDMERNGLVRHTKPPEGPPLWSIVSGSAGRLPSPSAGFATQQRYQQAPLQSPTQFGMGPSPSMRTDASFSGGTSSSPVSSMTSDVQLQTAACDMSEGSSQSTPRSDMDTGESIDPEIQQALRGLEDDVGERVWAVLHAKPDELFTDSQLAGLIGGSHDRHEVGAWLKHLELEGKVGRTMGQFPILFGLSSNPQLQVSIASIISCVIHLILL